MRENPPKYQVLYEKLRQEIENKVLPAGSKIPSETQLMHTYGFSRQTVRKSLDELATRGYIHKVQGSGSFVREMGASPTTHSKTILLMVLFFDHHFFPYYIKGIEDTLRAEGFSLTIKSSNYSQQDEEEQLNEALQGDYAGILLFPAHSAQPYRNMYLYRKIKRQGIAFITLGSRILYEDIPFVGVDDYLGGELMTEYLIQKGHRDIGLIMNSHDVAGCLRYAGYASALNKHGLSLLEERVIWYDPPADKSLFAPEQRPVLLEALKDVTAVFCFNDDIAMNLCSMMQEAGRKVPEDISVSGYDDSLLCELAQVPLTSIHQDPYAIGQSAAQNIIRLIRDPAFSADHVTTPILVERASVRSITPDVVVP